MTERLYVKSQRVDLLLTLTELHEQWAPCRIARAA
jgi:hypothetical protein